VVSLVIVLVGTSAADIAVEGIATFVDRPGLNEVATLGEGIAACVDGPALKELATLADKLFPETGAGEVLAVVDELAAPKPAGLVL
jgi:hypothetical protein